MGAAESVCPSEEDLADFVSGHIDPVRLASLEQHVASCEACARLAASVSEAVSLFAATATPAAAASPEPALERGARIGRYEILEVVGAGAMGVVYAAKDVELARTVALKLISARSEPDAEQRHGRLLREARAMAKVSHPHVITVHDVGTLAGRPFIAMELVEGGTLTKWLREREHPWQEIVDVFLRAGSGLEAAHAVGLVHRDFKPDNVLVGRDGRVRVSDFGLVRAAAGGEAVDPDAQRAALEHSVEQTITRTGAIVGTPAFMAPEQLGGEPADVRADVFAFAVSLYWALYGERPFQGGSVAALRQAIAREAVRPAPPGSRVPGRVRSVLRRGLRAKASDRFSSMHELLAALTRAVRWPGSRVVLGSVLAVAGLCGVLALFVARAHHTPSGASRRASVAVLVEPMAGQDPASAWLGTALADAIDAELGAGGAVRAIASDSVARAKNDLAILDGDPLAPETLRRLATTLGAEYVVAGAYGLSGEAAARQVRVDLRLVKAATGEVAARVAESGPEREALDVAFRAGGGLRRGLGYDDPQPADMSAVRASFSRDSEAIRLYASGVARAHAFDLRGARPLLEKAVALDDTSPRAHAALARVLVSLHADVAATEQAKRAFELSTNLSREERLGIEGLYREVAHEWDKAIELDRALWTFYPDNVEYGVALARAQIGGGHPKDAQSTIDALRALPPPAQGDPLIDNVEVLLLNATQDQKRRQELGESCIAKGTATGARSLVARGLLSTAIAARSRGEADEGARLAEQSRALYAALGDRALEARAMTQLAIYRTERGEGREAQAVFEQILATYRDVGDETFASDALSNLAIVARRNDDFSAARTYNEQALALMERLGRPASYRKAPRDNLATLYADTGDLPAARREAEAGVALTREGPAKRELSGALQTLAEVEILQGELDAARRDADASRELAQSLPNPSAVAAADFSEAEISLASGRADAAALFRTTAESQEHLKEHDAALVSKAQLARALVGAGKPAEALTVATQVEAELTSGHHSGVYRRPASIDAAFVEGTVGPREGRAAAAARLEALRDEGASIGAVTARLEAELALGQVELANGQLARGRARLAALVTEAKGRGYALLARRAAKPGAP